MNADFPCREIARSGYVVIKNLGSGLFGTCYLCKDSLGKTVVLKQFDPASYQRNQGKNHYEADILSTLSHSAIPELYGTLDTREGKYLILEHMPGITLKTALFEHHKVLSDLEIARIGMQLLSVTTYLHRRHLVHRDISIDNILDDGVQISLVDFGLSRGLRYGENAAQADYYCFGEVLLFLLYSRRRAPPVSDGHAVPWYEELALSVPQIQFIRRLLDLERRFDSPCELTSGFIAFMKKGLPEHL
ncbi:MAG: protein kinase family protein [Oscillospiraceae bacterium]|nr:protein kinase family protein [Oscillospiraceae bacterium]